MYVEISTYMDDKKRKTGFWTGSFSYVFPEAGENHIIERNLGALKSLGISTNSIDPILSLNIPGKAKDFVRKCKQDHAIKGEYCVFHPVSRRESKQWNQKSFARLIDYYSSQDLKVILTSGPEDEEIRYLNEIKLLANKNFINLSGKTSLFDLAGLLEQAKFFIGLDSVASHIAAAVRTPGVTLFGPSKPSNWRPWSDRINIISRRDKEDYCEIHGHLKGKLKNCLCYITPQKVIQSVESLFN